MLAAGAEDTRMWRSIREERGGGGGGGGGTLEGKEVEVEEHWRGKRFGTVARCGVCVGYQDTWVEDMALHTHALNSYKSSQHFALDKMVKNIFSFFVSRGVY